MMFIGFDGYEHDHHKVLIVSMLGRYFCPYLVCPCCTVARKNNKGSRNKEERPNKEEEEGKKGNARNDEACVFIHSNNLLGEQFRKES
jgi:hypothetical protein